MGLKISHKRAVTSPKTETKELKSHSNLWSIDSIDAVIRKQIIALLEQRQTPAPIAFYNQRIVGSKRSLINYHAKLA